MAYAIFAPLRPEKLCFKAIRNLSSMRLSTAVKMCEACIRNTRNELASFDSLPFVSHITTKTYLAASLHTRALLFQLALSIACAHAALIRGSMHPASALGASRRSAPIMFTPLGASGFEPPSAAAAAAATAALPASVLVGDIADVLQGFAGSPLILLVPMGAGALVASIIIFILVKSAG